MSGSHLGQGRNKLLTLALFAVAAAGAQAQLSGAIWTTTKTGTTVDGNLYTYKTDVYLNGGPQNTQGGTALPAGIYFFQVTTPSGALLLSSDNADQRVIHVNSSGHFDYECKLDGSVTTTAHIEGTPGPSGGLPIELAPFDDTTNNGGEYKAWLMLYRKDSDPLGTPYSHIDPNNPKAVIFLNRYAKTDNFKIKAPKKKPGVLCGKKWFDFDSDGKMDSSEPGIGQFLIMITLNGTQTVYVPTNADGSWEYPSDGTTLAGGTTYDVCEVLPPDAHYSGTPSTKWIQTAPGTSNDPPESRCYDGTVNGNVCSLDFGNTQEPGVSGLKIYDRNMNGSQEAGEPAIPGWPIDVTIKAPDGVTTSSTILTDGSGAFSIPGLAIGTSYKIAEHLGGGHWLQTGPAGNNYSGTITVAPGPYTVYYNQADVTNLIFGNIQQARLKGLKFFDTNGDGTREVGEPGIQGFKIVIDYTKPNGVSGEDIEYTDVNGNWKSILLPDGTTYTVHEVMPNSTWLQTFGGTYSGTITGPAAPITTTYSIPDITGLIFGNKVVIPVNAKTKGYWHNQNGYATMNDGGTIVPELQMLNGLCLVRQDGSPADFNTANPLAGFQDFSDWITNGSNGSNMACQLSAQLAAMELNVEAGFVSGDQLIFAPGAYCSNSLGIAKLSDLMAEANSSVCANPITTSSGSTRTHQTALEQALDNGNNNLNWVGGPIIIVSPY